jgi:hypothetical protein
VAEGDGLLNRYRAYTPIGGSNPPLTANPSNPQEHYGFRAPRGCNSRGNCQQPPYPPLRFKNALDHSPPQALPPPTPTPDPRSLAVFGKSSLPRHDLRSDCVCTPMTTAKLAACHQQEELDHQERDPARECELLDRNRGQRVLFALGSLPLLADCVLHELLRFAANAICSCGESRA